MKLSKNVNNKKCAPKLILFNENVFWKDLDNFCHRKLTLKIKILQLLTMFTQLNARPKFFLGLVIGLEHKGRSCKMCYSVQPKLGHTTVPFWGECTSYTLGY